MNSIATRLREESQLFPSALKMSLRGTFELCFINNGSEKLGLRSEGWVRLQTAESKEPLVLIGNKTRDEFNALAKELGMHPKDKDENCFLVVLP